MRKFIIILILGWSFRAQSQEMSYSFGYLFKGNLSSKGDLTLNNDSKKIPTRLKGVVSGRNKDTLFINFWDIIVKTDIYKGDKDYVNSDDNREDFNFVITDWDKNRHIYLPFRFRQLMATNLPFRVITTTGNLESEFLNANATYLQVWGRTKIFRSQFINTRNSYIGLGPYAGLSSIDNPISNKKEFGLNYGLNLVLAAQALNITVAYGFQNGFKSQTNKVLPYIGFGIGFKLLETFTPEIKDRE